MKTHETQYDICQLRTEHLKKAVALFAAALQIYREGDHHESFLDSPMMLELNEELVGLNMRVEQLIRKIDPGYEGKYVGGDRR